MSLLEILVVLAIAGVLIAVTAPSLDRYFDALSFQSKTSEIGRDIARMRITALVEGRVLAFPQRDDRGALSFEGLTEPLPEGWTIGGGPIVFLDTGACTGGALTLEAPGGRSRTLSFEPPLCRYTQE